MPEKQAESSTLAGLRGQTTATGGFLLLAASRLSFRVSGSVTVSVASGHQSASVSSAQRLTDVQLAGVRPPSQLLLDGLVSQLQQPTGRTDTAPSGASGAAATLTAAGWGGLLLPALSAVLAQLVTGRLQAGGRVGVDVPWDKQAQPQGFRQTADTVVVGGAYC